MARTARQGFRTVMGRDPRRVRPFAMDTQARTQPLDRAALFHYWHPDRDGVEHAPAHIQEKLKALVGVDNRGRVNAAIVRPPAGAPVRSRCWLVFKRNEEITNHLSPGWFLVLAWHDGDEPNPKPLDVEDGRLFANLYLQTLKAGREVMGRDFDSAVQFYDHCMSVLDADEKKREQANRNYNDDRAKDYFDYTKIKNIGHGSKFALHHDGTSVPSKGEDNWLRERGPSLPSDVVKRDLEERRRTDGKGRPMVQKDAHKQWEFQTQKELNHYRQVQQLRDFAKARARARVSMSGTRLK
jgi:hypothetical protein